MKGQNEITKPAPQGNSGVIVQEERYCFEGECKTIDCSTCVENDDNKEFWDKQPMQDFYGVIEDFEYLDSKNLEDLWCRQENEEDLRYEMDAFIDNALEEVDFMIDKYFELFGNRLEHPVASMILYRMRWVAKDIKDAIELTEKWSDSERLSIYANERLKGLRREAKTLKSIYRQVRRLNR